ncbi:MaoC family dehydratase N-terminal domain-containing protein [Patescibacteria group bacterium]|nr:MaoC family dehydratase N-terminal domain-containing protein [Patescibacteria group bacterium]
MTLAERGPFFEDFHPEQVLDHPGGIQLTRDMFQKLVKQLEFDDQLIHVDPEYARTVGYRDIILPGPIVYALVFRLSRRQVSWSGLNVRTDSMVHKYPVYPDDVLRASSKVVSIGEWKGSRGKTHGLVTVQTVGFNQHDEAVIEFQRAVLNPFRI